MGDARTVTNKNKYIRHMIYMSYVAIVMSDVTSIRVRRETKERLEKHGRMNESFDELINRILDEVENE